METLSIIYWSKVCFSIFAAMLCTFLGIEDLFTGLSLGMLAYILTHYILRRLYSSKVEDQSKIFKTGIGAYFLIWIVSWGLMYTLLHPIG